MRSLGNQTQGSLDGLCGIYAIYNALVVGCGWDGDEVIFQTACTALGKQRWPEVLWKGTTFADMQKMIKACTSLNGFNQVKARYPFAKRVPKSNADYWERFDEEVAESACAIIGVTDPFAHWIVTGWDGGHLQFLDSTAGGEFLRKQKSSLFAGERKRKPTQWLIDRRELIVLEVV